MERRNFLIRGGLALGAAAAATPGRVLAAFPEARRHYDAEDRAAETTQSRQRVERTPEPPSPRKEPTIQFS